MQRLGCKMRALAVKTRVRRVLSLLVLASPLNHMKRIAKFNKAACLNNKDMITM